MTTNDPQSDPGRAPEPSRVAIGPASPSAGPSAAQGYPPYGMNPYAYPQQYGPYPAPPPARTKPSAAKRALVGVGGAALAAGLVLAGVGIGNASTTNGTASAAQAPAVSGGSDGSDGGSSSGTTGGSSGFPDGGLGGTSGTGGTSGAGGTDGTGQTSASVATAKQQAGIVTVVSVLKYENAESAGTGMILTSNGEILTNNHVIDGATSVTVTVESTGKSYVADVVGDDPTSDVAVLQLRNASGLTTAKVGDASDVDGLAKGDSVTGVGNAGGTGTLTTAAGTVTALDQSITASDEGGQNSEALTGLIETNAGIIAGDSGGPLYDSSGTIVGMDTAGSSSSASQTAAATQAYAIPIDNALSVAAQIESGTQTSSVHIGLPAFMGIGVADSSTGGVGVSSVVAGGPAADAGITAGSVITAVGGTSIADDTALSTALAGHQPGDKVSVTWTDAAGASHTATVTLISGPAD